MTEQEKTIRKCAEVLEKADIIAFVETGKDLDGNGIYTVTMSDGNQFQITVSKEKGE